MYIQRRYLTCVALFIALLVCYFFRSCMSIAILSMVVGKSIDGSSPPSSTGSRQDGRLKWDESMQGYVLSAYFYGYFATNFVGSLLVESIGPRWTMILALTGASLFTVLTPVATYISGFEYPLVLFCRIMVGLFCGPLYPSIHEALARWAPKHERTTLVVITHSGNIVGLILAYSTGALTNLSLTAWQYYLYFGGGIGFLALITWVLFVYDDPWKNPNISEIEKTMIITSLYPDGIPPHEPLKNLPWKRIFSSWSVWTTATAHVGNNFILYMFLTNFPKYLVHVYNQSTMKASLYTIIPFVVNFLFQILASYFSNFVQRMWPSLSITNVRKINGAIGFGLSFVFLVPAGFTGNTNLLAAIILLALGAAFLAFNQPGFFTGMIDLSPNYAHIIMGISNSMGSISGFVSPAMIAALNERYNTVLAWKLSFIITGVVSLVCGTIWLIFGTSEFQGWEPVHHKKKETSEPVNI